MNKNKNLVSFFYAASFLLIFSVDSWPLKWGVLELNTLCFVTLLLSLTKSNKSTETSLSYYLLQSMSSFVILMSLAAALLTKELMSPTIFLLSALLFKMGSAPLHLWIIPISALCSWNLLLMISTFQKLFPILLLQEYSPEFSSIFLLACVSSMFFGSISNISSNNIKMLLIFSGISSITWFLTSLGGQSYLWKFFFCTYLFNFYFLTKKMSLKFSTKNPLTFLVLLSMGGIPPLLGFFPKMMILLTLTEMNFFILVMLMLVFSVTDLFVYSRLSMYSTFKTKKISSWVQKSFKQTLSTFLILNMFMIVVML